MARKMSAPITMLHSLPMPRGWFGGAEGAYPPFFDVDSLEQDACARLDEIKADPVLEGLEVKCGVGQGDPALTITEYANPIEDCLIMIPTHGYGKFRNLLLGSVTAKVLHDAKGAVWTDAHVESHGPDLPLEPKRILCGVALDGRHDVRLVQRAIDLAGSPELVRLVHAVPVEEMRPQKYFALEFDRFLMDLSKERMAELQKKLGVELQTCVRGGVISVVVRQTALLHGSNLVMIGRGVVKQTLGRLRTNSYAIIRDAPCPVLSL
jgi:nucleotide-binding universal stress UspA family protein